MIIYFLGEFPWFDEENNQYIIDPKSKRYGIRESRSARNEEEGGGPVMGVFVE